MAMEGVEMEEGHPAADEGDLGSLVLARFQHSQRKGDHHLCAVVGTIAQELRDHSLPLTPVSYFAAASSSLDRLASDPSRGPDPSLKALLYFLSMVLRALPPGVLRSRAHPLADTLARLLAYATASEGAIKAGLNCVARLLIDGDKGNWEALGPLFRVLLGFVTDSREKVRVPAHHCVRDVLGCFQGTPALVHASEGIAAMFERYLLLAGGSNSAAASTVQGKGVWEVLFTLNSLKESLPLMSYKCRTKILKYCKPLLELQQPVVSRAITEILYALSCSSTAEIPAEILLDLLCSLASSGSKEKSADEVASRARLLHVGTKKVYDLNRSTCVVKLPLIFTTLADMLACEHEEAVYAAGEALKGLLFSCIDNELIKQGVDQITMNPEGVARRSGPTIVEKICATVEGLLSYHYNAVWDVSFQVVQAIFEKLGGHSLCLMVGAIKNLADLETLSDEDLVYRKQLHECVGFAISAMGPEMFLKILPLNLESEELSKANIWLLPILKQYIVGAKLSFFAESIFNMIFSMKQRAQKFESEGLLASARTSQGIVYSLWSLLPSFCNYPVDTSTSFIGLYKLLCDALEKEPGLRGLICSSLQMLIQQNKKVVAGNDDGSDKMSIFQQKAKDHYSSQLAEKNLSAIRSCAAYFLSTLHRIFLNSGVDSGGCLQCTIREIASIADKEGVKRFYKKVMLKLLKVTKEDARIKQAKNSDSMQMKILSKGNSLSTERALLLDLAVSLLPCLDFEEMDLLFSCIKPGVKDEEGIIQKKAYKALSIILKERSDFLFKKLDDLLNLMLEALPSCHCSAKRHRLDSLYFIIVHVSKDLQDQRRPGIISSFLTEIILALKEDNKKTRNRAYDLLVKIGHACSDEELGGRKENLEQFFNMVAGGLAGETPQMISAAVKGLARLAYEFSDLVSLAYNLLPSAFLLLQRKNREICKANLGLVKVLVAKSHTDWLNTHLKNIVEGLLKWQDDTKTQFKAKVKLLIEMLVGKCGLDAVKAVIPEEHMKLLRNIRKTAERKERKAKSDGDNESLHSKTSSYKKSGSLFTKSTSSSRWNHTKIFSDVDDEDAEDDSDAAGTRGNASALISTSGSSRSKRVGKPSKSLPGDLADQVDHDPLDLLDRQKTRSVLKSSMVGNKQRQEEDDDFEVDSDGRLVVQEDGKKKTKREKRVDLDDEMETRSNFSHVMPKSTKHQRKRQKMESGWSYTGGEYTSKKAGGDVKRKNKVEPYAYWPLDRKLLNKREENRASARKGMANVIKMTKKLEGKSSSALLFQKGLKLKKGKQGQKKHK